MLALSAAGAVVPPTAIRATLAARAGGGWGYTMSRTARDSVDATSSVIEGLRAAGVPASHPALRAAATWILAQRNRAGGLASDGGGRPTDANSTASAIRALRSLGRTPPPGTRAALRAPPGARRRIPFHAGRGGQPPARHERRRARADGGHAAGPLTGSRSRAGLGRASAG